MNFLTTEELVQSLNQQEKQSNEHAHKIDKKTKKHKKFQLKKKHIFFFVVALIIFHLSYLGIQVISKQNGSTAFNQTHVLVVPMDQDLNEPLSVRVAIIQRYKTEDLVIGQKVAIYGKYGTVYYWIEEIVDINLEQNTLTTTFDGFISNQTSLDDVKGIYLRQANFLGLVSYVSTTPRGYLSIIVLYALVGYVSYSILFRKKKVKPNAN